MTPLVLAAAALGAGYYFFLHKKPGSASTPIAPTTFLIDQQSGTQFGVQQVDKFNDGSIKVQMFLQPSGTRILTVIMFPSTGAKQEVGSPPGTDPAILAAARRAIGLPAK